MQQSASCGGGSLHADRVTTAGQRTAFFWVITQRVVLTPYRRFGTTNRPHLQDTGHIGYSETSVMNYHYWMRSNREERSSHLRHGRKPEITHNAGQVLSELPDGDTLGPQVEALAWGWHPRLVKTRSSRNSFSEWAKARKRAEMSWKKEKMMTTMIMKMILMMTTTAAKWPWDRLRTNGHEVDYSVPSHQGHRDVELYLRFPDGMSLKAGGQYSFFITLFSAGGTALLNITFSIWYGALIKLQSARESVQSKVTELNLVLEPAYPLPSNSGPRPM